MIGEGWRVNIILTKWQQHDNSKIFDPKNPGCFHCLPELGDRGERGKLYFKATACPDCAMLARQMKANL